MNSVKDIFNVALVLLLILLLLLIGVLVFLVVLLALLMTDVPFMVIILFITRGDCMRSFLINLLLGSISLLILSWLAMTLIMFQRTGVL